MVKLITILLVFVWNGSYAASILLHESDAVVWHYEQKITGELSGFTSEKVIVHQDHLSFSVDVTDGHKFSFQVTLRDPKSKIWIEAPNAGSPIISDTLCYTLGYTPAPIVKPLVSIEGDKAVLRTTIIENPYHAPLSYYWKAAPENPALSVIESLNDSVATVAVPGIPGTYFYNLLVVAEDDSAWFQTYVIRKDDKLQAFNMDDKDSGYPQWMDDAIVYQITPYNFVADGTYAAITTKLPELRTLGINTIWLQPVFESARRGQGYDVTDYLALNPAFGTESELRQLIAKAKKLEMRVLFDLVLNHTSLQHPYAKDRIANKTNSHYNDFYQSRLDGKPYASNYHVDENGFIFYFWKDLVNLNYQNEEVQRWMLEVCKYWVREYDIDGYRFDAIWAVNARRPSFAKRLRTELKSIKPDVLLLAEDKGSVPEVFELGYDAAYDWSPDTSWVSKWAWEYEYENRKSHTIFNFPNANERGEMLRQALFHNGGNEHRQLRYIENNDLPRFVKEHQVERTKMAAALLFSLPGIPMLYNGQEIGFQGHPYSTRAVFHRDSTIQDLDDKGLFSYYQDLIKLHKQHPALSGTEMRALSVSPDGALISFHRWEEEEGVIVVVNLESTDAEVSVCTKGVLPAGAKLWKYRMKDILSGHTVKVKKGPSCIQVPMKGYSVRWLAVKK